MVGSDARIRVSSAIVPSLIGTLKSTRTNTRLRTRSRSLMESFAMEDGSHAPGHRHIPRFTSSRNKSTQRLEYPHSLSYHERTFTKSPSITFVYGASMIDEFALPLKSTDTSSSVENARIPFSGPSAADLSAAF